MIGLLSLVVTMVIKYLDELKEHVLSLRNTYLSERAEVLRRQAFKKSCLKLRNINKATERDLEITAGFLESLNVEDECKKKVGSCLVNGQYAYASYDCVNHQFKKWRFVPTWSPSRWSDFDYKLHEMHIREKSRVSRRRRKGR